MGALIGDDMLPDLLEVLPASNTRARDPYLEYCREHNIKPHPARMPQRIAEFFIRFLMEQGDLVLDPFAGSNTTGIVAERLKRKWISIEANAEYAHASRSRFSYLKPGRAATDPTRLLRSAR